MTSFFMKYPLLIILNMSWSKQNYKTEIKITYVNVKIFNCLPDSIHACFKFKPEHFKTWTAHFPI